MFSNKLECIQKEINKFSCFDIISYILLSFQRAMDKRRQMESEEYQNFLAETRNKKRNKILKALKRKKDMMDRSTKKINSLRAKYCQIPAFISRIHFDGLCRTKEDVLFLPEVKELFANVNNFEELIWATNHVILKLSDLGCFEDVFAEIDTDNSSRERYEVTFKMEEIGLIYLNPSLSNCTPYSNQSIRINPVISGKLLNIFGRAESLEGEFGTTLLSTDENTYFRRLLFSKPYLDRSNLSIFCEQMNYPNGNPYEQISEEKNLKMSASWFLANWWQHSLTFGASWRHLFVEPFKSISFNTREESGHSLKTSLCHDLLIDTTDDDILPTSGVYLNLKQEFAGLHGNVRFVKNFLQLCVYVPLISNVSLGVGTSIGRLATPTIESDNTNLFYTENRITSLDRFETGGPLTTRGFRHRGLGDYLGCSSFWAISSKLIFSLPFIRQDWISDNIKAHSFFDVANDISMTNFVGNCSKDLRMSTGVGLTFKLGNLGRAELNYAIPIRALPGDRIVHGIQFGLGLDFM
uniref:Sorting and assembly machinery component 50 homolog Alike [Bombyx mori] n=1 Tax=Lepeophtheirus salmonis TaxID=72036 RepID=A0A0K2TZB3_LEPSM